MNDWATRRDVWLIPITFLAALIIDRMVVPVNLRDFRPDLVAIMVIYWSLMAPHRVGVTVAWVLGLLVDVASGGLMGLSAAALSLQAYGCLLCHQQVRVLPRFQRMLFVLIILVAGKMLAAAVLGVIGRLPSPGFWLTLLATVLLWPIVEQTLKHWRREAAISS
ncbi:MAG: rod shape-determining protein MreD [Immundisolibacteraceae bacterium]|nr:rod shape-determining protein MreD [Immundisolibacteraceae bacterium]